MKILSNMHTHTDFDHAHASAEEMVESAINAGFDCLGFSGHSYTPFDLSYCFTPEVTKKYIAEIHRLRDKYRDVLPIYCGIELDVYSDHDVSAFDYFIASVHYIKHPSKDVYYDVDHTLEMLERCKNEAFDGDIREMMKAYFENVLTAAKLKPTILGHFDLITKLNRGFFDEDSVWYKNMSLDYLEKCVKHAPLIELNLGGMARGLRDVPYPVPYLLNELAHMNSHIIVSSDTHHKEKIDFMFDEAVKLLKNCGFTAITRMTPAGFMEFEI